MATHARKVLGNSTESRIQIKFTRPDLLWIGSAANPYKKELIDLPIEIDQNFFVGPTILDMLQRTTRIVKINDEVIEVADWRVRNTATLFPNPKKVKQRKPRKIVTSFKKRTDHPFHQHLASGGSLDKTNDSFGGFVPINKITTITIGEYAFRLAVEAYHTPTDAYQRFVDVAKACWQADVQNSYELWKLVLSYKTNIVDETPDIATLRPRLSISQEVERIVMREVFQIFSINPDLNITRPAGRPAAGTEGKVIVLTLSGENIEGKFKADYLTIKKGTPFSTVPIFRLIEVLGYFRQEQALSADADLLEAYLDAADSDWRDTAIHTEEPSSHDPYEVLGVAPDATMEQIIKAKRAMMKIVHPDVNKSTNSEWRPSSLFSMLVNDAFNKIKTEREGFQSHA